MSKAVLETTQAASLAALNDMQPVLYEASSPQCFTLTLPFPPSVNGYWRSVQGRNILSVKGRDYQRRAIAALSVQTLPRFGFQRLAVNLILCPPDARRRDVDNYAKATLDVLTRAGIWSDDSQIDELFIQRGQTVSGGQVIVSVEVL